MDITLDGKRITFDQATGDDYYADRAFASLCTQVGIPTEERETDSMELRGAIEYIFTKHLGKKVQVNRII